MKDVKTKKCPCGKHPHFGLPETQPSACVKCKTPDMVDLTNKKCTCGSEKYPLFGLPGKQAIACVKCNTQDMVDVKTKKCSCGKYAHFGLPGKQATACVKCKTSEMVDLKTAKCQCGKYANFGLQGEKAIACVKCKTSEMVDVRKKRCKANERGIPCPVQANKTYDGYCARCFAHLFPIHPKTATIRSKSKELKVVSHIASKYNGFVHDRPLYVDLEGGCCASKRRIDLRKLIGNTILAIEIDEEQRKYHLDPKRYDDLFMDFSGKYIFIRYNPDIFTDENGKRKNPQFSTRMITLEAEIENQVKRIETEENKELVEIIHLFYNK